jgi:hypothetical protein
MANEVKIEISLEEKQALDALTKLIKKTDEFNDKFKKGAKESTRAFDVFAGSLAANLAGKAIDLAADAARKMFQVFIVDGIKAAQDAESSLNKLNTALEITGINSEGLTERLDAYSKAIERSTKFNGDLINENMALLQSMANLTENGLKQGTSAAVDLAAAMGIDLEAAIKMVGKAANGEVAAFKKYGIEIKQGANDSETFANALTVLNSKFGGSAAAQADTYSGKMAQLKNAFGDLQEETGNLIVKNKDITEGIGLLTEGIVSLTGYVVKNGPALISTFREMADIFLITPVKFWSDLLGGGDTRTELELTNDALTKTSDKIEKLQKFMQETPKGGMLDGTFTTRQEAINKLAALIDKEQKLLNDKAAMSTEGGDAFVGPSQDKSAPTGGALKNDPMADVDVIFEQEKIALINQLRAEQAELDAENKTLKEETEFADNETKLANIEAQLLSENDLKTNLDAIKSAQEAKSTADLNKIRSDARVKNLAEEKKNAEAELALQMRISQSKITAANNFAQAGAMLAKEGSAVQKGILSAQAIMNTYVAASAALAPPPLGLGPVAGIPLAVSTVALGLANVAKINSVGFQTGGFVGGSSIAGDQNIIRANSDEFVATRAQQRNMIEAMANGNIGGKSDETNRVINAAFSQPIVVMVDGREIARATRTALKDGYAI